MNSSFLLKTFAIGLLGSASALAQAPPPNGPAPFPGRGSASPGIAVPVQAGSLITQSSRIRAFNPGWDGQVRSLYLSNGNVVDLSPGLGRQIGTAVRKGERVQISGFRSTVNGQTVIAANTLTLHGLTFAAQPSTGSGAGQNSFAPPPPPGDPNPGAGGRSRRGMARLGPQGRPTNGPGPNGPPPPPGPRPPGPQRNVPASPASRDGNEPSPPAARTDPSAPARPNLPVASPAGQLPSPGVEPPPNGLSF